MSLSAAGFAGPSSGKINLRVGLSISGVKAVLIAWSFGTVTTETAVESTDVSTAFTPTAVCAKSPDDNTIFVAGWNERTGAVVVEEWTLTGATVLGPPITPGWAEEDAVGVTPAFSEPSIQRDTLFTCDSLGPILDLVYVPVADQLLLLERTGAVERVIYSYLLASTERGCLGPALATAGTPATVLDSTALPSLTNKNSFWSGVHPQDGLYLYVGPRKTWKSWSPTAPMSIVLLHDANEDGVLEGLQATTLDEFAINGYLWEFP